MCVGDQISLMARQPGWGGGDLVPTMPGCVCVSKSEGNGSFFSFKGVK